MKKQEEEIKQDELKKSVKLKLKGFEHYPWGWASGLRIILDEAKELTNEFIAANLCSNTDKIKASVNDVIEHLTEIQKLLKEK